MATKKTSKRHETSEKVGTFVGAILGALASAPPPTTTRTVVLQTVRPRSVLDLLDDEVTELEEERDCFGNLRRRRVTTRRGF